MQRAHHRVALSDGGLHHRPWVGIRGELQPALTRRDADRQVLIKEQCIAGLQQLLRIRQRTDLRKRCVTGVRKGRRQVLAAVGLTAVAVHDVAFVRRILILAIAVEVEILPVLRMLPHVLERHHDLKGRARRIESLGAAVQQRRSRRLIIYDVVPVLDDRIRVEARLRGHREHLARRRVHGDHRALLISERVIRHLLESGVEGRHHIIPETLRLRDLIDHLRHGVGIGLHQVEVRERLEAGLALRRVADRLREHAAERVLPGLGVAAVRIHGTVLIHTRVRHRSLRKHLPVRGQNRAPHEAVVENLHARVVGVAHEVLRLPADEVDHVADHRKKQQREEVDEAHDISI